LTLRTTGMADAGGNASMSPTIPAGACGAYIQALDIDTCTNTGTAELSDVAVITPGDVSAVVTAEGGVVTDPAAGDDYFGSMDFKCAAWEGDVCTDFQVRVGGDECATYAEEGQWHTNLYVNSSEDRNCRLICDATTGNHEWTTCEGGDANSDAYWAHSWSQFGTECGASKYLWRTQDVPSQCDPWCLNIALDGTTYGGSPNLRVSCADW
jgi:hypothetical protein